MRERLYANSAEYEVGRFLEMFTNHEARDDDENL